MTLRMVTPAGGAAQVSISYAVGGQSCLPQNDVLVAGQVLDVLPGSPLETALAGNITALSAHTTLNELQGSDKRATSNCGT